MRTMHTPPSTADTPTLGPPALDLDWCAGYAELGPVFSVPVRPSPLAQPHWVGCNDALRAALGLPEGLWARSEVLAALAGNAALPGSQPQATVYSGHQFGVWAGQLGDGRALSLGTLSTPMGRQELQLKGAGMTPYSRMGDGRAVLRSSIREYLCSEAMWGLGIATTRALCVVGSPTPVLRETLETAAVVTRVAPSFVRFGHFEHFAQDDDRDALQHLLTHLLQHHCPELLERPAAERAGAWLHAIGGRTAHLVAQWQAVGFCHGVMNTDNMSALGLTLDYGPFQFMDGFDAHHICNHSDHQGRYAFARQPAVAHWNLQCLAQAVRVLLPNAQVAIDALEAFKTQFTQALTAQLNAKLGLITVLDGDRDLQNDLLQHLHRERIDWTVFWRRLSVAVRESATLAHAHSPVQDLFLDRAAWQDWLARYQARLALQGDTAAARRAAGERMLHTNPKFVLRNHLAELAIRQARNGDFGMVGQLLTVLHQPHAEHPQHEDWAGLAPEWASSLHISCSS